MQWIIAESKSLAENIQDVPGTLRGARKQWNYQGLNGPCHRDTGANMKGLHWLICNNLSLKESNRCKWLEHMKYENSGVLIDNALMGDEEKENLKFK